MKKLIGMALPLNVAMRRPTNSLKITKMALARMDMLVVKSKKIHLLNIIGQSSVPLTVIVVVDILIKTNQEVKLPIIYIHKNKIIKFEKTVVYITAEKNSHRQSNVLSLMKKLYMKNIMKATLNIV